MDKADKIDWELFTASDSPKLSSEEVTMIAQLHAKYFKHRFKVPCSCSPKRIQKWIEDLNKFYDSN
jgi:hypothetical protein|tara:strand:- start:693 stop:890 length:198 start_codon:yes stop_codon:yes gene_type:complete